MNHHLRLTPGARAKALEAGLWQQADGDYLPLRQMPDGHLVNALLREFVEHGPRSTVARLLATEIVRRGIEEYAFAVAAEREERSSKCQGR